MKHYPFTVMAALCGLAFSGANAAGQSTGGSRIPQQLVGAWTHSEWQMGYGHFDLDQVDRMDYRNQDPVGWTDAYRFFADGSYQHGFRCENRFLSVSAGDKFAEVRVKWPF